MKQVASPSGNLKLTYVTGQRGLPKLVIDGYSFVRNKGKILNLNYCESYFYIFLIL